MPDVKLKKKKKQTSSSLAIHQDYEKTTERNISNHVIDINQ